MVGTKIPASLAYLTEGPGIAVQPHPGGALVLSHPDAPQRLVAIEPGTTAGVVPAVVILDTRRPDEPLATLTCESPRQAHAAAVRELLAATRSA